MKQIIEVLFIACLLAGCQQETDLLTDGNTGYLILSSVKAKNDFLVKPGTRTVDPEFQLEICNPTSGTPLHTFHPGELTQQKIQLEVGSYLLKAYTPNHEQTWGNGVKGEAQYYKEQRFDINANQVNVVSVQVPMKNCAVTLRLPAEFDSWFTEYTFTVTQGSNDQERNVTLKNGETAYLTSDLDFSYSLAAKNHDDELKVTSGKVSAPVANTEYELTYSLSTVTLKQR